MTDPNRTSVGDVPAPITKTPGQLCYEAWWDADPRIAHLKAWSLEDDVAKAQWEAAANVERAAVVKYLRACAEFSDSSVRHVLLGKADNIEAGRHHDDHR